MAWFWHSLVIGIVIIPVTILWIAVTIDLVFRFKGSPAARIGWLVLVFVLPLIGGIIYLAFRPPPGGDEVARIADRQRNAPHAAPSTQPRLY